MIRKSRYFKGYGAMAVKLTQKTTTALMIQMTKMRLNGKEES